jgi:hypothetical protein
MRLSNQGSLSYFLSIHFQKKREKTEKKEKRKLVRQAGCGLVSRFLRYFLIQQERYGNISKNIAKPVGLDLETIFWRGFE